jgi:phage terminase large subunit
MVAARLPLAAIVSTAASHLCHIGGAGHSSDAMAIWVAEFVGREIRLLDYIEGVGQPLAYYATELRRRRWKDAIICLPHDGVAANNISGKRYIDHWIEAGFECGPLIKNTGAGAAMMRIEVARRVFPRCWFNETTTEAGRDALGYYHERRDENRNVGLGPEQTGPLMPQTVLAIWLSAMKSRR